MGVLVAYRLKNLSGGVLRFQRVAKDTVLWRPGDPADFAFLLVTGHVGVSWLGSETGRSLDQHDQLAFDGSGEFFMWDLGRLGKRGQNIQNDHKPVCLVSWESKNGYLRVDFSN